MVKITAAQFLRAEGPKEWRYNVGPGLVWLTEAVAVEALEAHGVGVIEARERLAAARAATLAEGVRVLD